jgi:hypothetical protein
MQFAQKFSFIHRRRPSVVLIVADFYDLTLRCIRTGKPCMSILATQYFTDIEITLTRSRFRLGQKQKLRSSVAFRARAIYAHSAGRDDAYGIRIVFHLQILLLALENAPCGGQLVY